MGRWDGNARERLERAAHELFTERGYEESTVADIAARAGLTERTFFRHYADKREVVFAAGSAALRDLMLDAVDAAPADRSTIAIVREAVEAAARFPFGRLETVRARSAMIAAHADLRERAVTKRSMLTTELASALRRRGVAGAAASLAADVGITAFYVAFDRWIDGVAGPEFIDAIREVFFELADLLEPLAIAMR